MVKHKILFINANRFVRGGPIAPLGLGILCAALKEEYDVNVLDLSWKTSWKNAVDEELIFFNPMLICISFRNIDNSSFTSYESFIGYYISLVKYIRGKWKGYLIGGGSGFTIMPDEMMHILHLDYGIIGYGEFIICKLVKSILMHDVNTLPENVLYFENNELQSTARRKRILNKYIKPDWSLLHNSLLEEGDLVNIEATRGCMFNCTYCSMPQIYNGFYIREFDDLFEELEGSINTNHSSVFFVDNILNFNKEYFCNLCNEIYKRKLVFNWQCQIHPHFIDEECLKLAKKAGMNYAIISAISIEDTVLHMNKKGFDSNELKSCVELFSKYKINSGLLFLLGIYGDSMSSASHTIKYINEIASNPFVDITIDFGCRIFKNTELYKYLDSKKQSNDIEKPIFYIEDEILRNIDVLKESIQSDILKSTDKNIYEILCRKLDSTAKRRKYISTLINIKNKETMDTR